MTWNSTAADSSGNNTDVFLAPLYDLVTNSYYPYSQFLNGFPANMIDSAIYNNNVLIIPVSAASIGLTDADPTFSFEVDSYDPSGMSVNVVPGLNYDAKNLAVDTSGGSVAGISGVPAYYDLPGNTIQVAYNKANLSDDFMGLLLLHHHNGEGARAQVVTVRTQTTYLPFIGK